MGNHTERYSIIHEKNPREILLLRGSGCRWRRCAFCDYHLDFSDDVEANYLLNRAEIRKVTGRYRKLEVINSGSFSDLDRGTMQELMKTCGEKGIKEIHFESHWMHRGEIPKLRGEFASIGVAVKVKIGVETFDADFRENVLRKGIAERNPPGIARDFDEACLLFGLTGQTEESMRRDVETGLRYFERVCINIMVENTTGIKPDAGVIRQFREKIFPDYREDDRVDVLFDNKEFGVYAGSGEE